MTNQLPSKYIQKKPSVEAVQVLGWSNAWTIWLWSDYRVFFVPQGHEHNLRKQTEHDRSRGDILTHSDPYMVLERDKGYYRVDYLDWIVKDEEGNLWVYKDENFRQDFDPIV